MRLRYLSLLMMAAFFVLPRSLNAQERNNKAATRGDTVSVRIQGDSIVYRYRPGRLKNESSPAIATRTVPDSVVQKYKTDEIFAYANDPAFWKKEPPPDNSAIEKFITWLARSAIIKWMLYLFLAGVILFVVYQVLVVNNLFAFSKRNKKVPDVEVESEEIDLLNLNVLFDNAVTDKNYRLAVRYLYLKTLKLMHDRGILVLDGKLTNHDYSLQIQPGEKRRAFTKLVSIYEYAWYGDYTLNDHQFGIAEGNFKRFIDKL